MNSSEYLFEISDNQREMLELIRAIPKSWEWTSGDLYAPQGDYGSQVRLSFVTAKFGELRDDILACVAKGYRGHIEVCRSAYQGKMHLAPAKVDLQLSPWRGERLPELGHQPARIAVCTRQMIKNEPHKAGGFEPIIDTANSGTWEDIGPIVRACRQLGLRPYSLALSGDLLHPWSRPSQMVQAAE